MPGSQRVALALGSGGARGYAHIGVLQVLGERGFEVAAVAGSSMGALVGGVMAAGRLDAFTEWAVRLKQRDVLRLIDPTWGSAGAMTADRLIGHLDGFLTDVDIEQLPIPYTAVATDIVARREVWFQKGRLRSAVRASIAIPGVITPVTVDGRLLADGGLLNPVPIEPTASAEADLTIAVSLQAPRSTREPAGPVRAAAPPRWFEDWPDRVRHLMTSRNSRAVTDEAQSPEPGKGDKTAVSRKEGVAEASRKEGVAEASRKDRAAASRKDRAAGASWKGGATATSRRDGAADLRIPDVLALSLDAMQDLITRYRMAGLPPDVHIAVPVSACGVLDFHRAADLIALGRDLTTKALADAGY